MGNAASNPATENEHRVRRANRRPGIVVVFAKFLRAASGRHGSDCPAGRSRSRRQSCPLRDLAWAIGSRPSGRAETGLQPSGRFVSMRVEIIEPLRALRRRLRTIVDATSNACASGIKAIEIEAEEAAQLRLAEIAGARFHRRARAGFGRCRGQSRLRSCRRRCRQLRTPRSFAVSCGVLYQAASPNRLSSLRRLTPALDGSGLHPEQVEHAA